MRTRQYRLRRPPRGSRGGYGRSNDLGDLVLQLSRPRNLRLIAALFVGILAVLGLLPPGEIRGPAEVVDGDTLVIGGLDKVRLYGIDAPELDQPCRDGGPCGRRARAHLAEMIGRRMVSCDKRGSDKYGRNVAQCFIVEKDANGDFVRGADIGRLMVRDGQAMAYRDITKLYAADEPGQFDFIPPWDWRERQTAQRAK